MPFTTAFSGLNAASNNLAVTGNNIANSNTVGFKKFAFGICRCLRRQLGRRQQHYPRCRRRVANVAQQFNQGNLTFTDNNLDLAISGEGFFTLAKSPDRNQRFVVYPCRRIQIEQRRLSRQQPRRGITGLSPPIPLESRMASVRCDDSRFKSIRLTGLPSATDTVHMQLNVNAQDDFTPSVHFPSTPIRLQHL
jgi:flagellar hook protein FlgE